MLHVFRLPRHPPAPARPGPPYKLNTRTRLSRAPKGAIHWEWRHRAPHARPVTTAPIQTVLKTSRVLRAPTRSEANTCAPIAQPDTLAGTLVCSVRWEAEICKQTLVVLCVARCILHASGNGSTYHLS